MALHPIHNKTILRVALKNVFILHPPERTIVKNCRQIFLPFLTRNARHALPTVKFLGLSSATCIVLIFYYYQLQININTNHMYYVYSNKCLTLEDFLMAKTVVRRCKCIPHVVVNEYRLEMLFWLGTCIAVYTCWLLYREIFCNVSTLTWESNLQLPL